MAPTTPSSTHRRRHAPLTSILTLAAAMGIAGCEPEETVISERGLLIGLPGAERGGKPLPVSGGGASPLETVADGDLVRTTPTGERFIICQSPRHVIVLTRRLLSGDAADGVLFYNQLIADDTKRRAIMEGNDPARILDYFNENKAEIFELLNAMPMGELSPDVAYEPVEDGSGRRRERLRIRTSLARKLEFTQLWVQREEGGQYKLLWVK